MANVMSIDESIVSEGEKVCNFNAGLRLSMQRKCAYDPSQGGSFKRISLRHLGGPFKDFKSLVVALSAIDSVDSKALNYTTDPIITSLAVPFYNPGRVHGRGASRRFVKLPTRQAFRAIQKFRSNGFDR